MWAEPARLQDIGRSGGSNSRRITYPCTFAIFPLPHPAGLEL